MINSTMDNKKPSCRYDNRLFCLIADYQVGLISDCC